MRRFIVAISLLFFAAAVCAAEASKPASDINAKVAQLDINKATIDDVIRIFGEPEKYFWSNQTFTKDNLPSAYIAAYYSNSLQIVMTNGKVTELRFEGPDIGYIHRDKLRMGSSLDEAILVLGQPTEIVDGQVNGWKNGVLYKDINGNKGFCYYERLDQNIRLFFANYKVASLYVTRSTAAVSGGDVPKGALDINAKIAQLDINKATLNDVIRVFGEPEKYIWGDKTFTKDSLPTGYIATYPNSFQIVMNGGKISEVRHHEPGYIFRGKIQVGSSLDEVFKEIGQPKKTVIGQRDEFLKDGVLYKDIDGKKGSCYYSCLDLHIRMFFTDNKVAALYITSNDFGKLDSGKSGGGSFQTVRQIESVKKFDDVRWGDMSRLNLSEPKELIHTLTFNGKTVWPEQIKKSASESPEKLMKATMNPGLGIHKLHKQGITGKGVNVAIIDQPMYLDHPEFTGKIVEYHDVGCGLESSMHGPAVTSLLVGTNCGTAPDAKVYYVAAPSWTKDTAYQAKALGWIIEQNKQLPAGGKIRVVSVSAAPSGIGSPFEKNLQLWDEVCAQAEASGILVLDCTFHHGFINACWYDIAEPENVTKCIPGYPGLSVETRDGKILVPASPRTTAEEYNKGDFSYQYCGRGGLSWAIPYCAGVLAMGWQVRPELSPQQMRELLFESAYTKSNGAKIIYPENFIKMVKTAKAVSNKNK